MTGRVRAAAVASIVAVPVFMAAGLDFGGNPPVTLALWICLSLRSIPVAVSIAILPVALAVMLGGWIGIRQPVSRDRLILSAVGTAMGMPPILLATDTLVPDAPLHAVVTIALVIPLVARHFIAWRE